MCTAAVNVTAFAALTILVAILKCNATKFDQTSSTVSSGYGIQLGVQYQPDAIAFPSVETRSNYYHHHHSPEFHNFHHHHHDFHHHHHRAYDGEDDNDDENAQENVQENLDTATSSIPLDLMLRFNNYTDVNELLLNLVEGSMDDDLDGNQKPILSNRFGSVERNAAVVPKAASCIPETQTVKIVSNDDPSVLYIPSCTRIERCGGCCSHSLLSCQPTDADTVSYQVVKTQFVGGSKLKFMGKEVVLVEKHTKCKCSCRVQEKDCNSFQEYRPSECRCACTNTDEEKKCYKENATKLWNPDVCGCQCRNILQCSTGFRFDTLRCRCMAILVRRRFAELPEPERSGYKSEALPVIPLNDMDNKKP